ncbi:MAG: ABC transporter permease [Muribaculaceae bacterium]|nr:ABC transporter permease [Muribaculaceae bacterium]
MKSYFKFLSRNKAYAAIDVFGLAVSMMFVVLIGCYTWQETHIDRQHTKADRIYYIGLEMRGEKTMGSHWYLQFLLKDRFPEIESSTALYRSSRYVEHEGKSIETNSYFVDSTFFDIFDFKLIQGDRHTVLDDPSNIVVTREYARKVWGDEDPMGKSLMFNKKGHPLVVAGVMEPMKNTAFMTYSRQPIDMLLNFKMIEIENWTLTDNRMPNATGAEVILLAKEGHDLSLNKKEYEKAIKKDYWILNLPEDNIRLELYPFSGSYLSDLNSGHMNFGNRKMIKLLSGVGLVILLFAIMNYINLTVALAGKRAKEMATRRLLGESRHEILWRLIGESALLCSISMILGIALAFIMQPHASSLLNTPIDITGCLNITTISFLVIILLIMSLTSGVLPAILLSSMKPIEAVKGGFRRRSNMIYGKVFIVVQNVATIVMIACALTMYIQVRHLINAPLGYDPTGIVRIPNIITNGKENGLLLRDELLKLPCVEKVSFSQGDPHSRGNNNTTTHEGRTVSFQVFVADSSFMDILGIKLKKDNNTGSDIKDYLNQQAINELNISENDIEYPYGDENRALSGIIEDFKIGNILTDQHPVRIVVEEPFEDFGPWTVLIKTKGDQKQALEQIREVYEGIYSSEYSDYVFEYPFLSQSIENDFKYFRHLSMILTVFAIIAIIISILGLTAMSTYYVRQRASDSTIHKVMGGTSEEVLAKLVRTFMTYVLIAAVISIPIIYFVMNDWLSQFSYRISVEWWIYAASAMLAITISFFAIITQCVNAANTNPVNSLK